MVLTFCGLYATGCLEFYRVVVTNIINVSYIMCPYLLNKILVAIIFLIATYADPAGIIVAYAIYLLMVLALGSVFLYVLEKSRKQVNDFTFLICIELFISITVGKAKW